jgi:His/Glu/Gln/Arg/opine family amino acid ABC transporter permease subunit
VAGVGLLRFAGLALVALAVLPGFASAAAAPQAFFLVTPGSTVTGKNVLADASASSGDGLAYAWSWGDGDELAAGNVTAAHAYRQAGVFVVTLRVTDLGGAVAFANQSVLVIGSLPSAYFQFDRGSARDGGFEVVVNATFSEASRGATRITSYSWDWGEGAGLQPGNVTETHFYAKPGAFTITLRVVDDQGRASNGTQPVIVRSTFVTRLGEVWQYREFFWRGALLTIELAVVTTLLGFTLAVALALLRISRLRAFRWPAATYIEFIRGTPLLVQVLVAWLVLPSLGLKLDILYAGALALVVNTSAYQAEAIRAGIQGIPSGQMEAALSLGMTPLQAMRRVVLPQAFRLTLPALGNEFIILLKDTSLVGVIGVVELAQVGRIISARTFLVLEVFLFVALIYFAMTYVLSTALRSLEKRLAIPGLGIPPGGP